MNAICLIVAGVVRASLPGPEFTLEWAHSVEKTRWEETYRIDGDRLLLEEARVEGSGAGMEPPLGAQLRDGRWTWHYTLCAGGRCAELGERIGATAEGEVVTVRACEAGSIAGK